MIKDAFLYTNQNWLCQYYLQNVYDEIQKNSQYVPMSDYGELLFEGGQKLISQINFCPEDRFVDFGSGRGKLVSQIFLQTNIQEAIGVELVQALHLQALQASQKIRFDLPPFFSQDRKLNFYHANFLNFPVVNLTICFINSICFLPQVVEFLGHILNAQPDLHTVFSLRPIPSLANFVFKKSFRIECSWDSALCYLYQRKA